MVSPHLLLLLLPLSSSSSCSSPLSSSSSCSPYLPSSASQSPNRQTEVRQLSIKLTDSFLTVSLSLSSPSIRLTRWSQAISQSQSQSQWQSQSHATFTVIHSPATRSVAVLCQLQQPCCILFVLLRLLLRLLFCVLLPLFSFGLFHSSLALFARSLMPCDVKGRGRGESM